MVQKAKHVTPLSFKGQSDVAAVNWSHWNSNAVTEESANSSDTQPTALSVAAKIRNNQSARGQAGQHSMQRGRLHRKAIGSAFRQES